MNALKQIKAVTKKGNETLSDNGINIKYTLFDFWRWSVSDILSNATRGLFAEFIVGTAIDFNIEKPREEWGAYDLLMDNKIKIEVKSAAYIQSWNQNQYSSIKFSIKPSKYWDTSTSIESETKRHADVYVFCHLKHLNQDTIDPLKMEQWDFYVLATSQLNNYKRSQTSITLKSLQSLTNAIPYTRLKEEIIKAYNKNCPQHRV